MILKNGKRLDGCSDTVPIGTVNPYLGTVAPFGYLLLQGQYVSKSLYPELYAICGSTFGPETDTEFKLPDLRGQTIAGYKEGDSTFGTLGGLMGALTKSYTPAGTNTDGAVQSHSLTVSEIPEHTHMISALSANHVYSNQSTWDSANGNRTYQQSRPNASGVPVHNGTSLLTAYEYSGTNGSFWVSPMGDSQGHSHDFTQPTFTGTQTDINVVQPTIILNWVVKAIMLIPNQSTVVNATNESTTNVYSTTFINNLVQQVKQETLNSAFPIGKVEVFYDDADHSNYLGFTWVRELEGLSPVGYKASDSDYSTIGSTLGSKTHSTTYTPAGKNTGTAVTMNAVELTHSGGAVQSHTLTAQQIPKHKHGIRVDWNDYSTPNVRGAGGSGLLLGVDQGANTAEAGGGQAHSHGFTQPSKHSFTPTTKSITQPTFTGTQATISMDTRDPQKVVAYWRRVA